MSEKNQSELSGAESSKKINNQAQLEQKIKNLDPSDKSPSGMVQQLWKSHRRYPDATPAVVLSDAEYYDYVFGPLYGPDGTLDELFRDVALLEGSLDAIQTEFLEVHNGVDAASAWSANAARPTFRILERGEWVEGNCRRCPATASLLRTLKRLMVGSEFGNAMFCVVYPGTVLPEDFVADRTRVRCHLGLVLPKGSNVIVGFVPVEWAEGKCIMFDGSIPYEMNGPFEVGFRASLMLDFWPPSPLSSSKWDYESRD